MDIKTCEFVSPKHPDKLCDFIADVLLDAHLKKDKESRVALEVMGGHNLITVSGEVTSRANIDYAEIIRRIVGKSYRVKVNVVCQSQFIAQGVDKGGAGDQGIMVGYACSETKNFMPLEYEMARQLCRVIYRHYPYDGKVQITLADGKPQTIVASFQNSKSTDLLKLVRKTIKARNYLINPAGEWNLGGLDADSGLSGRKLVADNYGPQVPIGGGSFSGKDSSKVDRSGAYMARKIAVDLLKKNKAKKVLVKLAYAIGIKDPVMAQAEIDDEIKEITGYDLSPGGIAKALGLRKPIFAKTSYGGHFGREFPWG